MNCFQIQDAGTKSARRKAGTPSALQNIPTILEIQDFPEYMKNRKDTDGRNTYFENNSTSTATSSSASHCSESLRRLSFRLGSDADESNYNSSSSRTTPSFTTGNYYFDFDGATAQSRSSSGYSTPSPKVLSNGTQSASPGTMFLEIPRDPFQTSFGPISNSHSSDKLVSNETRPALTPHSTLHVSRSCSMLTKGVFGGKGSRTVPVRPTRRRSSQTDHDDGHSTSSAATSKAGLSDASRKSSHSDNSSATDRSIFTRLIHRWQSHLHQNTPPPNDRAVPAHALFLRYGSSRKSGKNSKSTRSHSETEAVEKSVKQRLKQMVRRNTDSVLKHQAGQQKSPRGATKESKSTGMSNRPTPEDARSWQDSFDTLLSSSYGTALFRAFLQLEYNEENLAFYLACEKFKRLDPSGHRKIATKAQKIYDEFIRVEAPREVNLDSITRATTVNNLSNPNRHCFDHAQRRVRHVLEKDVYPRFLKFDLYIQLLPTIPAASPLPLPTSVISAGQAF